MTDETLAAQLDDLAAAGKRLAKLERRGILLVAGTIAVLALVYAVFTLLGLLLLHDRLALVVRELAAISGLAFPGLAACAAWWRLLRRIAKQDDEIVEAYRRQAEMMATVNAVRPLLAAINDAHSQGMALVVPPPDPDGRQPPPKPLLN